MLNNSQTRNSLARDWFMECYDEIYSRASASLCRLAPQQKEEALAEVLAMIYSWAVNAARSGKLHRLTPFWCVQFATRHYRQGRRVTRTRSCDVISETALARSRVKLLSLESLSGDKNAPGLTLAQTLADRRTHDQPPEQARRNLDYPQILQTVSPKACRLFLLLSQMRDRGCGKKVADLLGVSPGRVCQLKGQLARALSEHGYVQVNA